MISYSLMTKVGNRSNNEDHVGMYLQEDSYYFALADGLGGHGKGEVASEVAVETAIEVLAHAEENEDRIAQAFEAAQKEILLLQQMDRTASDMKTTFVLLQIKKNCVKWGYIGDSRLYYFKDKKLISRTLDHSVPQMLVSSGKLKEKHIRNHPDRNRLLRVMGVNWEEPRYQLEEEIGLEKGQAFLLCTDGFWELIDESKMISCCKHSRTPKEWLEKMEEIILKNSRKKDMDNYSAIGIWVE